MNMKRTHTPDESYGLRNDAVIGGLLILVFFASGCVINFKSEKPTKGIIHVDVQYVYPGKCEMNSVEGFYKKELEPGHYAQTKIELDPGQQLLILNKALVLHFFEMPVTFARRAKSSADAEPQSLRIHADSLDRTIQWQGSMDGLQMGKYHPDELIQYVDSIVRSTEEYQGLPAGKS